MSLGENSLVAAYKGRGQLKSRPSGTRVVTSIGGSDGGIRDPIRKRLTGHTTDTRSKKKETDEIRDTANERLCVKCQCLSDWCGYVIQCVRDIFRDSVDYKRQRTNISLRSKRLVWRCGGEDKETLANAKRLYSS